MYKIYVIKQSKSGSRVLAETRTQSPSFAAASAAFWELHAAQFDEKHLLLMSKDKKQINAYRYNSKPGERDYIEPGSELKS